MTENRTRKTPTAKDPKIYAYAVEYGLEEKNIPPRPLFGRTLDDYEEIFKEKVLKAQALILSAWR